MLLGGGKAGATFSPVLSKSANQLISYHSHGRLQMKCQAGETINYIKAWPEHIPDLQF